VYVLTGLLPLALAMEHGLWPAAAIGGGAMLLFVLAPRLDQALRATRPAASPSHLAP
jgi:hypothetical protein